MNDNNDNTDNNTVRNKLIINMYTHDYHSYHLLIMRLALLLLITVGYCTGTLYPSWFNQTKACNFCGQLTYGVMLSANVETLISAIELYSEV